ncbi:hypothetical protein BDL97_09G025800 [Sphagnum fallax]|nr:hypothetical protein BDL97_09G025800 [Sphagnum fallax]
MVKVKGVEWNHVVVVKEPEKHGMATLVRCAHCEKEFQGNAMRIRAHLLGNKRSAGVSGCPSCPEEAWEELRIIDEAKCLTKRKREARRGLRATSTALENGALDNGLQMELMTSLQKGEKTAMEQAFRNMVFQAGGLPLNFVSVSPFKAGGLATATATTDLGTFFEGFGVREETVTKIKEMGFTGKTFMSNLDELPSLLESIKQHCHLSVGEEWGIKGAAKKWQKDCSFIFAQPDGEKWCEPENGAVNDCLPQS